MVALSMARHATARIRSCGRERRPGRSRSARCAAFPAVPAARAACDSHANSGRLALLVLQSDKVSVGFCQRTPRSRTVPRRVSPCRGLGVSKSLAAVWKAHARAPSCTQSLRAIILVLAPSSPRRLESNLHKTTRKRLEGVPGRYLDLDGPARIPFHVACVRREARAWPIFPTPTTTIGHAHSASSGRSAGGVRTSFPALAHPRGATMPSPPAYVWESAGAGAATEVSSAIACEWILFRRRVLHHSQRSERCQGHQLAAAACERAILSQATKRMPMEDRGRDEGWGAVSNSRE